jgi:hypothetical protein
MSDVKLNMVICSGSRPHCAECPQISTDCATCHHALPHHRDQGCNHRCWSGKDEQHTCHTVVSETQWWDEIPEEPDEQ